MTTAPLSFTDQTGYYGLRVSPSFDKILGTVRNPLRIPLPDRSAKWYALSPYRALILDAAQKYNDYEHMASPQQMGRMRCGTEWSIRTRICRSRMPTN